MDKKSSDLSQQDAYNRNAQCFLDIAERRAEFLTGPEQAVASAVLESYHPHLLLTFSRSKEITNWPTVTLRMAVALSWFWLVRGYTTNGLQYLKTALECNDSNDNPVLYAKALNLTGFMQSLLATNRRDNEIAGGYHQSSLKISRILDDQRGIATALEYLCIVHSRLFEHDVARQCIMEAVSIWRQLDNPAHLSDSLRHLGVIVRWSGDVEGAIGLFDEALVHARQADDDYLIAKMLDNLGSTIILRDDVAGAQGYLEEAISLQRSLNDKHGTAVSLNNLGRLAHILKDYTLAEASYLESLRMKYEMGVLRGSAYALEGLAAVWCAQGKAYHAVKIWGAAHELRENLQSRLPPSNEKDLIAEQATARKKLGDELFEVAFKEGQSIGWEPVVIDILKA